jgi:hypothetical protein
MRSVANKTDDGIVCLDLAVAERIIPMYAPPSAPETSLAKRIVPERALDLFIDVRPAQAQILEPGVTHLLQLVALPSQFVPARNALPWIHKKSYWLTLGAAAMRSTGIHCLTFHLLILRVDGLILGSGLTSIQRMF